MVIHKMTGEPKGKMLVAFSECGCSSHPCAKRKLQEALLTGRMLIAKYALKKDR